ncbi:MAG: nucleotidyltransferase domain-containing protein [Nanoarchaeota archaeon]|nr:nucleotidyltransferase domain-containing protein [Nanoarchaeota archaeon]
MDTYKVKWTKLQAEIFRFLCINAGQNFNLRGIAKPLKVSPTAVSNALHDLQKNGLIKIEKSKTMNLMSIEFNRDNEKAINLKRVENLRLIYESGIMDFLESKFPGCTIMLFGSYSRGEDVWYGEMDDRNSDIDIVIINTKEKEINLEKFERELKRKIFINFYKSWKFIHKNLKNNILNGILFSGGVEI